MRASLTMKMESIRRDSRCNAWHEVVSVVAARVACFSAVNVCTIATYSRWPNHVPALAAFPLTSREDTMAVRNYLCYNFCMVFVWT